jgi:hypothetical protein
VLESAPALRARAAAKFDEGPNFQAHSGVRTVASFIVGHAGCNQDAELTRRLQNPQLIEVNSHWPVRTRLAGRRPNRYIRSRLNALSRVMHGHTGWWVWSKVQVLQLGE